MLKQGFEGAIKGEEGVQGKGLDASVAKGEEFVDDGMDIGIPS